MVRLSGPRQTNTPKLRGSQEAQNPRSLPWINRMNASSQAPLGSEWRRSTWSIGPPCPNRSPGHLWHLWLLWLSFFTDVLAFFPSVDIYFRTAYEIHFLLLTPSSLLYSTEYNPVTTLDTQPPGAWTKPEFNLASLHDGSSCKTLLLLPDLRRRRREPGRQQIRIPEYVLPLYDSHGPVLSTYRAARF